MENSAKDVAQNIINKMHEKGYTITNLKLQKLLYYTQGISFTVFEKSFFDDEVYAWQHGPVVKAVYWHYSRYASRELPKEESIKKLEDREDIFLDYIVDQFGKIAPWKLVDMTHEQEIWKNHVKDNSIITKSEITNYFKKIYEVGR